MLRMLLIFSTGIILILLALVLFWWPAFNFPPTPLLATGDLSSFDQIHRLVIVFPGDEKREKVFLDQWRGHLCPNECLIAAFYFFVWLIRTLSMA
jgi:hypothetical protein